jgi:hypothetical protein
VTALLKLRHPEVPVLVSAAWPHLAEAVRALGAEPVSTVSSSIVRHVGERTGGRQAKPWLGGPWLIEGGAARRRAGASPRAAGRGGSAVRAMAHAHVSALPVERGVPGGRSSGLQPGDQGHAGACGGMNDAGG